VDEAARHGDRLLVLAGGRLLFAGTPEEMVRRHGGGAADGGDAELAFMRLVAPEPGEGEA
jgi:ABC-type multidrug transport system ATPase subunit